MNTSHVITTTNADTGKRTELDSYGPVGFNNFATIRESFQCVAVGPSFEQFSPTMWSCDHNNGGVLISSEL